MTTFCGKCFYLSMTTKLWLAEGGFVMTTTPWRPLIGLEWPRDVFKHGRSVEKVFLWNFVKLCWILGVIRDKSPQNIWHNLQHVTGNPKMYGTWPKTSHNFCKWTLSCALILQKYRRGGKQTRHPDIYLKLWPMKMKSSAVLQSLLQVSVFLTFLCFVVVKMAFTQVVCTCVCFLREFWAVSKNPKIRDQNFQTGLICRGV